MAAAPGTVFTWVVFIDGMNRGEVKAATHEEAKAAAVLKYAPGPKMTVVVYAVVDVR